MQGMKKAVTIVFTALLAGAVPGQAFVVHAPQVPLNDPLPLVLADANESDTSRTIARIGQGRSECGALPAEYRADCLGQAFNEAAAVQHRGDYRSSNRTLKSGGRELRSLARQNRDRSAPAITQNGRRYVAVKKEVIAEVNRKAIAIVTETETKLLRSASGRKKVHYQRIARAVNSTKVIFRS